MRTILHVIEASATGTLAIVRMAANEQARSNKVIVIFSRRPETPKDIEKLFVKGVIIIEVNLRPSSFVISTFSLRKYFKNFNPDIIHCHSSFGGFFGRLSATGCRAKLFYSPHCISFMREDIGRFKKIIFKYFELAASLREGTYIACSLSEFDAIRKMLPSARVALCENAVDFEDFQNIAPVSRKFPTDFVKVVSVGGIRPQKGPLEFAKIAARFDKKNIRFVWVGDGGRELRDVLIGAGVTVTGWMSREETIEELHASDVYLSTARWEGMPVSVIEACAANTPVILRNSAGNVDIVKDGESGFLFSNTEQCIELLNEYLEQPARFRSVARVAYKQVFERFSVDRFVQKLSEIYNV